MATFVSSFFCGLIFEEDDDRGFYVTAGGSISLTATDRDDSSQAFALGETIWVQGPAPDPVAHLYIASYGNGWIGHIPDLPEGQISYFLFLNGPGPTPDTFLVDPKFAPFTVCFLTGTRIATPTGPRPVEALLIGDTVVGADGSHRAVRWIGRQTVVKAFADPLRSHPIRIAAGALGANLPARDLLLSPDHAILVDGVLVQASALVTGTSIARVTPDGASFTYFHVELEEHALILAEGVPAETFVDNVTRRRFDNFAEYEALYGDGAATMPEIALPRVKSARQLPQAIRGRLAARADVLRAAGRDAA